MKRGFLLRSAPSRSRARPDAAIKGVDHPNDRTLKPADAECRAREGMATSRSFDGGVGTAPPQPMTEPAVDMGGRQRDWSALPGLPLGAISLRLPTLMDHFSFCGVCASWRSAGGAVRWEVMASQPPLFFAYSLNGFYHLAEKRVYKKPTKPLNRPWMVSIAGFSQGYLILWRGDRVWLSNPLSGAEKHCFPRTQRSFRQAIVSSPSTSLDCVLVAYERYYIQYCRPGDEGWCVVYWPRPGDILYNVYSVAIVGEKGYALLEGLGLAVFDFTENPKFIILNDEYMLQPEMGVHSDIFLAESKGEIFAFSNERLHLGGGIDVFRFDPVVCKWVRSGDLGGRAVFLGAWRMILFVDNHAKWGGSKDCIYFLDPNDRQVVEYKVKDGRSDPFMFPTRNPVMDCFTGFWVVPSLS